jgi:hypothetical protein
VIQIRGIYTTRVCIRLPAKIRLSWLSLIYANMNGKTSQRKCDCRGWERSTDINDARDYLSTNMFRENNKLRSLSTTSLLQNREIVCYE